MNNQMYRISIVFFVGVLGCLIISPVNAQQESNTTKQVTQLQNQVQQLFELQDSITIPERDKDVQEFHLRQQILTNIINTARQQALDARARFEKIDFPSNNDLWNNIRDSIINSFKEADTYYESALDRVNRDSSATNATLKNVARDIENQKTTIIDPFIKQAHTIIASFTINDMLQIGDDRLEKIRLDVEKIYNQKLTRSNTLQKLFNTASSTFMHARTLNDKVQETLLHIYAPQPTASDTQYLDEMYTDIVKNTKASSTNAVTSDNRDLAIEAYIQDSITDIITDIKSTYDTFLKMSTNVKGYIK